MEVTTESGDVFEADKVLVTVSVGVLKSETIEFIPEMSETKKTAIDSVPFFTWCEDVPEVLRSVLSRCGVLFG